MNNALVSVIIPTFNCETIIEECLNSVKHQSYQPLEIIVVDSFSTDRTPVLAQKYGTVLSYGRDPKQKNIFAVPFQRNYGAQKSNGLYIYYIDSDMRLPSKLIETCVDLMEKEAADAIILPEVSYGEGFWTHCRALEKACYNASPISCTDAARFIRKSVWTALAGLDPTLGGGDDFDFQIRLNEARYKTIKSKESVMHYEGKLTLGKQIKKKFVYGKNAADYLKKHTGKKLYIARQYSIIRPDFLRNGRLLLKDPLHACGMIFMKFVEYAAAFCGLVYFPI